MSQLILPNSIDAGTEIVAAEHQANYVAIRDAINGQLEGQGLGNPSNLIPHSVDAQDLEVLLNYYNATQREIQAGVVAATGLQVTPGAGLQLSVNGGFGWVSDTGNIVNGSGASPLIPVFANTATLTIAANASGNPRIDQIIATITDFGVATLSVLQGTATVGATLANRSGAAALPSSSIRLADILMPNGFAGPFVATTHIRDRRTWAKGFNWTDDNSSGDITGVGTTAAAGTSLFAGGDIHLELGQSSAVVAEIEGVASHTVAGARIQGGFSFDGVVPAGPAFSERMDTAGEHVFFRLMRPALFTAGHHTLNARVWSPTAGTYTVFRNAATTLRMRVYEVLRQDTTNAGA